MDLVSEYSQAMAKAMGTKLDWNIYVMMGGVKVPDKYHFRKHREFVPDKRYKNWQEAKTWIANEYRKFEQGETIK